MPASQSASSPVTYSHFWQSVPVSLTVSPMSATCWFLCQPPGRWPISLLWYQKGIVSLQSRLKCGHRLANLANWATCCWKGYLLDLLTTCRATYLAYLFVWRVFNSLKDYLLHLLTSITSYLLRLLAVERATYYAYWLVQKSLGNTEFAYDA